jgi:hypothetical protein
MSDEKKSEVTTITEAERKANFKADVSFLCPFCLVGFVSASKEQMAVMHTMPMCARFEKEEPDVFLESCRKKMERV